MTFHTLRRKKSAHLKQRCEKLVEPIAMFAYLLDTKKPDKCSRIKDNNKHDKKLIFPKIY